MMISGIAGTAVMTIVAAMAPMMGMPEMSPPAKIAAMTGLPLAAGWIMHFMIGIMFAALYGFIFYPKVDSPSKRINYGLLFGLVAFVIGQIGMMVMANFFSAPPMQAMLPLMMGSAMGHLVYGLTVAFVYTVKVEGGHEHAIA